MKRIPERFFQTALLSSALALLYFSYTNDYVKMLELYLVIHGLGLLFHLLFDKVKSKLFISVFVLFLISSALGVVYAHIEPKPNTYVYLIHAISFVGLFLIFMRMLQENPPRLVINKRSILVVLVIAMDLYFGYKIIELVNKYELSLEHLFFGFIYTILKMVLMSAGFIFYLTSGRKSRKISLLNWSFICFFFSDIIDTLNTLVFMMDPIPGGTVLQNGLLCLALFFFYMYCTSPDVIPALEKEPFL